MGLEPITNKPHWRHACHHYGSSRLPAMLAVWAVFVFMVSPALLAPIVELLNQEPGASPLHDLNQIDLDQIYGAAVMGDPSDHPSVKFACVSR